MQNVTTETKIGEILTFLEDSLYMPIPNRNCIESGDQLTGNIIELMLKIANCLINKLREVNVLMSRSVLGTVLNKYMRCTYLIVGNQLFLRNHIMDIELYKYFIVYQVKKTRRDFY